MTLASQPLSRRERNKQEKLERIMAAASELFAEHGVEEVTTQQIADKADIGTGTLFLYAKTKGELLLLVQNAHYAEALERGRTAAETVPDPLGAVMAIMQPIVECNRTQIDNGRTYLREMAFGDPEEPHHSKALAIARGPRRPLRPSWSGTSRSMRTVPRPWRTSSPPSASSAWPRTRTPAWATRPSWMTSGPRSERCWLTDPAVQFRGHGSHTRIGAYVLGDSRRVIRRAGAMKAITDSPGLLCRQTGVALAVRREVRRPAACAQSRVAEPLAVPEVHLGCRRCGRAQLCSQVGSDIAEECRLVIGPDIESLRGRVPGEQMDHGSGSVVAVDAVGPPVRVGHRTGAHLIDKSRGATTVKPREAQHRAAWHSVAEDLFRLKQHLCGPVGGAGRSGLVSQYGRVEVAEDSRRRHEHGTSWHLSGCGQGVERARHAIDVGGAVVLLSARPG